MDGGKKWAKLNNNMPTVAVHDLVIHPRDNDLIAATHGRGIWIMDDITPLQQLSEKVTSAEAYPVREPHGDAVAAHPAAGHRRHARASAARTRRGTRSINYYLGSAATGQVQFEISDVTGENKRTLTVPARAGINRLEWPMTFDPSAEAVAAFAQQQAAAQQAGRQGGGGGGGGGGRGRGAASVRRAIPRAPASTR